jgi:hypothetical protein
MWCHRHRNNISLLLFCVESSGQCSNTTRALDYASIISSPNKNRPAEPRPRSLNEFLRILKNVKNSRIFTNFKTLSNEFSIYDTHHPMAVYKWLLTPQPTLHGTHKFTDLRRMEGLMSLGQGLAIGCCRGSNSVPTGRESGALITTLLFPTEYHAVIRIIRLNMIHGRITWL